MAWLEWSAEEDCDHLDEQVWRDTLPTLDVPDGITVDKKGNVWIGGNGGGDGHILKFTQDGKFIMQVGKKGVMADSNSTEHFLQVAKVFVDDKNRMVGKDAEVAGPKPQRPPDGQRPDPESR